jgi:hypothetical protein
MTNEQITNEQKPVLWREHSFFTPYALRLTFHSILIDAGS